MIGGYFGIMSYCDIPENTMTEEQIMDKLNWYIYHANNKVYDLINYEWICYLDIQYENNSRIHKKIKELKQMIAKNYLLKEKMKARITLKE